MLLMVMEMRMSDWTDFVGVISVCFNVQVYMYVSLQENTLKVLTLRTCQHNVKCHNWMYISLWLKL